MHSAVPANCTTFGPALQNLLLLPGPYMPTASTSSSWRHSNQYIPKHNFVGRKKFPAPIHVLTVPSHLGHVYTPDTSKPKCHEPLYSPWPFGPVHTPAPWALPSSQPPQYVPPSSKSTGRRSPPGPGPQWSQRRQRRRPRPWRPLSLGCGSGWPNPPSSAATPTCPTGLARPTGRPAARPPHQNTLCLWEAEA